MKLKRNVVLLATNQRANLAFNQINSRLLYDVDSTIDRVLPSCTYQHLYITSDEEIKKVDWYIDDTNAVRQAVTSDDIYWKSRTDYKKIIATTDKSLGLPSPSDGFIKKFIERYNAGTPITEVMVEYEEYPIITYGLSDGEPETDTRLKVDKDNCITITAVKDSWTREEVVALCRDCFDNSCKYSTFNEWIEQNL